jgi:ATP-dependent RNA helicase DDX56/DBP9
MVTTPSGLVSLCKGSNKLGLAAKDNIKYIAIDEADLVLSHGFEKDIKTIVSFILPKEYQAVLVSATLSDDLDILKGLILRSPLSVIIQEKDISGGDDNVAGTISKKSKLSTSNPKCMQYYMRIKESRDKFLVLYGMVKMEMIGGRILIFTSTIDSAYRLKIFFDKFAVKSGVYNSEMPIECRNRVLSAYNDKMFNILIAGSGVGDEDEDPESCHRGIDFSSVDAVINFDLPKTVQSYIHRAGRTARGGKSGIVVSYVEMKSNRELQLLAHICESRPIEELSIAVAVFEPLRYRVEDVVKGISRRAIAASRQKELLNEILHNDQLKKKLSENSEEVQALRQSVRSLREHAKVKWHLQNIPEYLISDLKGVRPINGNRQVDLVEKIIKKNRREENEHKMARQRHKVTLREKLIRREVEKDKEDQVTPEELAPISGRKLWKMKHHKVLKKPGDNLGKPPRVARKLWKHAKKFS